ncbi:hypothetical protein O1B68_002107 [Vibrio cholerae]|nr:hypothetical protein [Vibrio cholerae]
MGGSSKKQTVGYRYYLGMHLAMCHGPVDAVTEIQVADRQAWSGSLLAAAASRWINLNSLAVKNVKVVCPARWMWLLDKALRHPTIIWYPKSDRRNLPIAAC